jgi:two-component system, LytTR family, response regulator
MISPENNTIVVLNKQLKDLQEYIIDSNLTLKALMECQISLESQFQEMIKLNNDPTISIKSASKIDFVPIKEIIYLTADLSYTEIISENHSKILASKPINDFDLFLTHYSFYRINKSVLINLQQVHSYNRKNNQVIMKNKDVLDVARRRKTDFLTTILPNDK